MDGRCPNIFLWVEVVKKNEIDGLDENTIPKNNWEDCILQLDIESAKELHDLHNDYSLAPEKIEIEESILSNYFKEIANKYNISADGVKKLVPSFAIKCLRCNE